MSDQFLHVPLAEIVASLTNPRTSTGLKPEELAEMAEDIKRRGVDTPILLRPLPGDRVQDTDRGVKYELVAGERRLRASILAKMPTIPARVRVLDDVQALQVQLAENMHRQDLSPLEEAQGFQNLMDKAGITADQVGERIEKSRRYVYNRLALLKLGTEGRDALRAGKLDASRALLLSSVPNSKLQLKAIKYAIEPNGYTHELPTVRELQNWLRQNVMLDLKHAVFKITDARLVEAAGSCKDCSKRTGADPDLFSHVDGADMCTDPPCFHKKGEAHHAQLLKKAEAKGMRVVEGKEALELLGGSRYRTTPQDYLRLDAERLDLSQEGERPTTLGKALGKDAPAPILFIHPKTREAMELVPEEEAEAVLLAKGLVKPEQTDAGARNANLEGQLTDLQEEMAHDIEKATHEQIYSTTLSAIHTSNAAAAKALLIGETLRAWLLAELDVCDVEDMARDIGLELKDGDDEQDAVSQRIHRMGDTELLRAVAGHMLYADHWYSRNNTTPVLDAFVKRLGVDTKAAKRAATNSVKAEYTPKIKAIEDKIAAKKTPATTAPAAQATGVRGKAGAKTKPAAAAKTSAEEAKRGIAAAMQGLEGSASAPKGAVAPSAAPGGMKPAAAWPFPPKAQAAPKAAKATTPAADEPTDPLYAKARALVLKEQQANKRQLKDGLGIGQDKANALLDQLEAAGVIGPAVPRQPREVLLDKKGNALVAA